MRRCATLVLISLIACSLACTACSKEIIDLEEAMADPDFSIQGEYVGEVASDDGPWKAGVQVIALGGGNFRAVGYRGGLPGDGWKRGGERVFLEGPADALKGDDVTAKIADGKITFTNADGKEVALLSRTERKSPTLGAKPPEGAVVLFDGASADQFDHGTITKDKTLLSGVTSKPQFGDCQIHLEFSLSWMPDARGQGRSNSGIYIHHAYECQVLDSFGLEGENNECGGFYSIRKPAVNMCFPPLTWQTYDIDLTAPKYENGQKVANARATIRHNGVVIHNDLELPAATPGGLGEGPAPRSIYLQGHGNKVQYRNIWVKEK